VKFLAKKYFILLLGLLFVAPISLEPLFHEFSEDEYFQAECKFCQNALSTPTKSKTEPVTTFLSSTFLAEINEIFISFSFANFYSRAPPK